MSTALSVSLAAGIAALCCYTVSIFAMRFAVATGFVDRPTGYKSHCAPTPYLGGLAVISGMTLAIGVLVPLEWPLVTVLVCTLGVAIVGTIDDLFSLAPLPRVAAEIAFAGVLFAGGVHWAPSGVAPIDFAVTAIWVVGVVNAFNLMDNLDGSATTVAGISGVGIGVLALTQGDAVLAVAGFSIAGACAGFLPHNLAGPARIFLGDGGSMPLGFIVAGLAMVAASHGPLRHVSVLIGAMIVGLPILDTTLVVVSRIRRGVPILKGGLDHLTHRLLARLGSPRRVAASLAFAQGWLVTLGVCASRLDAVQAVAASVLAAAVGFASLVLLESPGWRPVPETGRPPGTALTTTGGGLVPSASSPRLAMSAVGATRGRSSTLSEEPARRAS